MSNTMIFWAVGLSYFAFAIGLGIYIWNKVKGEDGNNQLLDFWLASRKFSGWRLGISLAAGWLMLGWLGYGMSMIYQMGLSGIWILPLPWFILCFIIILMVPFVRRLPAISLPEALDKRFGGNTRLLCAIASIFVFTSWTGAELFMIGKLASPFLNISPNLTMLLVVIPIMIYTFFGGFRAVVITDVIQFALMAIFITVLGIVSVNIAGKITDGKIIATLSNIPTASFGKGTMFNLFAGGFVMPIILLLAYLPGWMIEQDLLLRIQGAKSLKEAKKGAWVGLLLIGTFIILIPTVIAFCAIILFPPGLESTTAAIGGDASGIITAIILKYFPLWGQVVMFVGLLAAQMATVDTFSNVVALPLTYDIIQPTFLKNSNKNDITKISRTLSVVAILIGFIYAINSTSLSSVYILSSGVLSASIAIPAFAIFFTKVNKTGISLSIILGFLGNIIFYILEYKVWGNSYSPKWLAGTYLGYIIVGLICSIFGLIVGSIIGEVSTNEQLDVVAKEPLEGVAMFSVMEK